MSGPVYRKIIVARIRAKTLLLREEFACVLQVSSHVLRKWELEQRVPEGPAWALLTAIDREPKTMMRLLGG
jgi:putative transcriptional regulator